MSNFLIMLFGLQVANCLLLLVQGLL